MRIRLIDLSIYDGMECDIPDGSVMWDLPEPVYLESRLDTDATLVNAPRNLARHFIGLHPSVRTPRQAEEGGTVFIWEGLREPLKRLWEGKSDA